MTPVKNTIVAGVTFAFLVNIPKKGMTKQTPSVAKPTCSYTPRLRSNQ